MMTVAGCDVCERVIPRPNKVWCFKESANVEVKFSVFTVCEQCGPMSVQTSSDVIVKYREAKPCSWCGVVDGETLKLQHHVHVHRTNGMSTFTVWGCRTCTQKWHRIQYPPVAQLLYLRPQHTDKEIQEILRTTKARPFTPQGYAAVEAEVRELEMRGALDDA